MSDCTYRVTFRGEAPEQIKVGDVLEVAGRATVQAIGADLVDITAYGRDPEFLLGEATVDLAANRFEVKPGGD